MPQLAKNPMMTPVHLTVKQNITSLPVLCSRSWLSVRDGRLESNIGDVVNVLEGIIQGTVGKQTLQHATNAEKTITVRFTMTRLAKRAQIQVQEHLLSKVSARPPRVHQS